MVYEDKASSFATSCVPLLYTLPMCLDLLRAFVLVRNELRAFVVYSFVVHACVVHLANVPRLVACLCWIGEVYLIHVCDMKCAKVPDAFKLHDFTARSFK